MSDLLLHTKSRIAGKNADVRIYENRIEWSREPRGNGWNITSLVLALCTCFISLIWMRPQFKVNATEVIPSSKVTSVSTEKEGPVNTKVTVVTSGNTIEFRTGHDKAQAIKNTITGLVV